MNIITESKLFPFNIPLYGIILFISLMVLDSILYPPVIGDVLCKQGVLHVYTKTPENGNGFVAKVDNNGQYTQCFVETINADQF